MKVIFTDEAKRYITVAELPKARKMIRDLRKNTYIDLYACIMAKAAAGGNECFEVLKTEAEVAKNNKKGSGYFNDSTVDVQVKAYTFNRYYGFFVISFYLSDARQYDGDNTEAILSRMYVERYAKEK